MADQKVEFERTNDLAETLTAQAFWSYVHVDNEANGGRIATLARDVAAEFEMQTAEPLRLFLDRDTLRWGDEWRSVLDANLESVACFIAVLTPRYRLSAECRRELQFFLRRAERIGVKGIVLPLLYIDIPDFQRAEPADDLLTHVKKFQWEDWRDLRFRELSSEPYRRAVARLAERLAEAVRQVERSPSVPTEQRDDTTSQEEEEPGWLDQIAKLESGMPRLIESVGQLTADIETIGKITNVAVADLERASQGQGMGPRLLATRRFAGALKEPVDRIWTTANTYAAQLHDVDEGYRAVVDLAKRSVEQNPQSTKEACELFAAVRRLSDHADTAMVPVKGLVQSISAQEHLSKDLRPVLRRLREGLTIFIEGNEIIEGWIQMINATGIECTGSTDGNPDLD